MKTPVQYVLIKPTALVLAFYVLFTPVVPVLAQQLGESTTEAAPAIAPETESQSEQTPAESAEPRPEEGENFPTDSEEEALPLEEEIESNSMMMSSQPGPELNLSSSGIKSNLPDVDRASGALVFNYPIVIPPGRNGLQPDLKLVYNSQGGQDGKIFGAGWSLNLSSIERINRKGTEKHYSEDFFQSSMDGELVSLGSGSYGPKVENGEFQTYSYSSSSWTVTDKKGATYKFGTTSSSRQDNPSDSSKIYRWMIDEIRDANNNYIKYEYSKDQGEIYPWKITYTGNNTIDGIFVVEFTKTSRTNAITYAKPGFTVNAAYYVTQIDAKINGTWAKRYVLAYTSSDNGQSNLLLNTITESGQDESSNTLSMPVIDFDYQAATVSGTSWPQDTNWSAPLWNTTEGVVTMDVNGDALDDIVKSFGVYGGSPIKNTYLNTGSGSWSSTTDFVAPVVFQQQNALDPGVRPIDVNGDGLIDLVLSTDGPGSTQSTWLNDGDSWESTTNWQTSLGFSFTNNATDTGTRVADINGDGLPDLIKAYKDNYNPSNITSWVYVNNGSTGWTQNTSWTIPVDTRDSVITADVNGDGLDDLIQAYDSSPDVFKTWINNGTGWTYTTDFVPPVLFKDSYSRDQGVRALDVNGDGLADLLQRSGGSCGTIQSWLNNGTGWSTTSYWQAPLDFTTCNGSSDIGTRLGDFNGDGKIDFMNIINGSISMYLCTKKKADVISKITYPRGGSTEIVYQGSPQYMNGSTKLNPSLPLNIATVRTITNDDGFNLDSVSTYTYEGGKYYYNGPFDRKLAGFSKITKVDSAGNKTKTFYHQGDSTNSSQGEYSDHYSKIGKIYRVEITDSSDNVYAKKVSKWENYDLGSARYFVKLTRTTEFSYDGDSDHKEKASTYSYSDTNGNLLGQVDYGQVSGSDDGSFTDSGTDDYTSVFSYVSTTSPRLVSLQSQSTTTDHGANKVLESKYYYDSQSLGSALKGNLTKREDWKTGTTYIDIEKTYNSTYGTLTSDIDQRNKTTTYSYDSYNLYPTSVTNPLSQTTAYTYDYSIGKPKQTTDPNTRVFQTVYDALDRVIEEKQPDLTNPSTLVTKNAFTYTNQTVGLLTQKTSYLDASSSADNYVYSDGFDRPVQTRTEMEGAYAVIDTIYNNIELKYKESLPYTSSGTGKTTATTNSDLLAVHTYDSMYRVTSTVNAAGTITNAYDDWKQTITDARGKTKSLYRDAYNNLIQVDELNGSSTYTTNYQFDINGKLTNITDALGNVRNFTYDGLGRRTAAQDLHATSDSSYGSWTYTYDDAGNITSLTDPKSQQIDYTYDDINRKLTENYTGQSGTETTYTYDSGTDGIGRLTSTAAQGAGTAYSYNSHGKVIQEVKTISSTAYQTDFTFDRQGNTLTITSPDSSVIKYGYNTAGQIENVERKESTDGAYVSVISNFDYGPHGKVTTQTNANGTTETNTYDATKLYRMSRKQTSTTPTPQTVTVYAGAGDGYTRHVDDSWDIAHDATDSAESLDWNWYMYAGSDYTSNYQVWRMFLPFNTSSLPDDAVVTSANLKVWVYQAMNYDNDGDDFITVVPTTQASTSGVSTADHDQAGAVDNPTEGINTADRKDLSSITSEQYLSFPLNTTGKSWVSATGYTKLGLREGHDILDHSVATTYPTYSRLIVRTADYEGTSNDPYLEITYTSASSGTSFQDLNYTYDANGNVTQIVEAASNNSSRTVNYVYDDLNRLTSATATNVASGQSTYTHTYTYDAIGNLLTRSDGAGTYTYGGSSGTNYANPHQPTGIGSVNYTYDNNGNMLTETSGISNTWDYNNKLTQVVKSGITSTYGYDHNGQRVKSSNGTTTTYYPSKYYNIEGSNRVKHIFVGNRAVATVTGTGSGATINHIHTDHLTGANVVTNGTPAQQELLDYFPYGNLRMDQKAGSFGEQRKYAGSEYDADSSLNYMGSRYYHSSIGKFISQDPMFLDSSFDFMDPQSLNSTAYARNNPLRYNDPDGQWFKDVITGRQSWNDFVVEVGDTANYLYDGGGAWQAAMDHPVAAGAIIGTAAAVTAVGTTAAMPYLVPAVRSIQSPAAAPLIRSGALGATGGVISQGISDIVNGNLSSPGTYMASASKGAFISVAGRAGGPIAAGTAAAGISVASDVNNGRPVSLSSAAISAATSYAGAKLPDYASRIPGRLPNIGSFNYYFGKHAQQEAYKEGVSTGLDGIKSIWGGILSSPQSSKSKK